MGKKRFKHDIPNSIIGMTFEDAKLYCLSEGFQLFYKNNHGNIGETYIITISEVDSENNILKANYGI